MAIATVVCKMKTFRYRDLERILIIFENMPDYKFLIASILITLL